MLILKELHERLDAAVADAYGWPADLPNEEILSRLVALNKERAAEEAKGNVRWLRPEYQIPRFGTPKEKAAVMAVLMSASQPLDAGAIAATFKQGRKATLKKVEAVLSALNNTGFLDTRDGGRTFLLRRVA